MVNDEILANVERLASQALDMPIICRYLDLSPSDANDARVAEAFERGRAKGAAAVMSQVTVASSKGSIPAAKMLLQRLDSEPAEPVSDDEAETVSLLWPNPSEAAERYETWLKSAHAAMKEGSTPLSVIMSCRPVIDEAERLWLRQHSVELISYEFDWQLGMNFKDPPELLAFLRSELDRFKDGELNG